MDKKRLFIELEELDHDRMGTLIKYLTRKGITKFDTVYDEVANYDIDQMKEVVEAIKSHDEIYADTALIDNWLSPVRAGMFFSNMIYQCVVKDGAEGKSVFIFRIYSGIIWNSISKHMLTEGFKKNYLYCLADGDDLAEFEQVDIDKLLKENF